MRASALGLALAWLAPLGQAEKLPIETFFKDPEFNRMRLSPDGKWLAAIAPREGKNNLLTIRLSDRKLFGCTAEDENPTRYGPMHSTTASNYNKCFITQGSEVGHKCSNFKMDL